MHSYELIRASVFAPLNTHEIAQNCVCNARKSLAAEAPPQTMMGELIRGSPKPLVGWEGVNTLPQPLPSASRFVVVATQLPVCPSQNNFLDPPLKEK